MHGFKDTTRTQYVKGGPVGGPRGAAQHSKAMADFKNPARAGGKSPSKQEEC